MNRLAAMLVACGATLTLFAQSALDDFARGAGIRTDGTASIYRVMLHEDAYATVTRNDLSDLRVFNAAGEPVPHALREAPPPPAVETAAIAAPHFPLHEKTAVGSALTQVRVSDQGTVMEVRRDPGQERPISAYLVDASALETAIDGVVLAFEGRENTSFLSRVAIEASDDLSHWRTLVQAAAIARLQHESKVLDRGEIEWPPTKTRYLRISWPSDLAAVGLASVRLRPARTTPVAEIHWRTLGGTASADDPGVIVYDTRARLPVEQVNVVFADPTDAVSVTIRSRSDESSDWREVHTGLFYALGEPTSSVSSAPARVGRTADRYWRVETIRDGGWRPGRLPRLSLGWRPHELVFLARGAAPYTLAYGSARAGATDLPVDAVLSRLERDGATDRTRPAALEAPRDLAGTAALTPDAPLRQFLLWGVLIVAVLGLAWFALRAFREPRPAQP